MGEAPAIVNENEPVGIKVKLSLEPVFTRRFHVRALSCLDNASIPSALPRKDF